MDFSHAVLQYFYAEACIHLFLYALPFVHSLFLDERGLRHKELDIDLELDLVYGAKRITISSGNRSQYLIVENSEAVLAGP